MATPQHILVTGATGYVGGRLVPCLLEQGYRVRCFVRDPDRLQGQPWADEVEVAVGDVLDEASTRTALEGIDAAYYLIHSLAAGDDYDARDRQAADTFGRAAHAQGVDRIVYLGGLEPKGERVSKHLESRLATGDHLRQSGVPVTEFRAAVIVGSGSLSFELVRYLTERLPFMICPKWVHTPTQPIAIRTVLEYLTEALRRPETAGQVYEIGGTDVLSYRDMFDRYAKVRGLSRLIINVPFLTPRLSSLWVGVVTPVNTQIARALIEGLDNEVVVHDDTARRVFDVRPLSYEAAVRLALRRFARGDVATSWHSAFSSSMHDPGLVEELDVTENLIRERRTLRVRATPHTVFGQVQRIGGDTGWLYANLLWRIRGYLDLMAGGIGLRKTRRSYTNLRVGDVVDFWRVEAVEPDRLLRLRAEMKVPGKAWLEFRLAPGEDGRTCITQTAYYEPKGLFGLLYWWVLYPAHKLIFPGMIHELGRRAEAAERGQPSSDGAATALPSLNA